MLVSPPSSFPTRNIGESRRMCRCLETILVVDNIQKCLRSKQMFTTNHVFVNDSRRVHCYPRLRVFFSACGRSNLLLVSGKSKKYISYT